MSQVPNFVPPVIGSAAAAPAVDPQQLAPAVVEQPAANTSAPGNTEAPKPELSERDKLVQKVETAQKAFEKAQANLAAYDAIGQLAPGVGVMAEVGRADTKRVVAASVLEVKDGRVGIFFGQGMEAQTAIVAIGAIKSVIPQ